MRSVRVCVGTNGARAIRSCEQCCGAVLTRMGRGRKNCKNRAVRRISTWFSFNSVQLWICSEIHSLAKTFFSVVVRIFNLWVGHFLKSSFDGFRIFLALTSPYGRPTLRAPHPTGAPPYGRLTLRAPHPTGGIFILLTLSFINA